VIYRGARGPRDDVAVRVKPADDRSVAAPVPFRAQTGPLDVWVGRDAHSTTRKPLAIMPPPAPVPNPRLTPAEGSARAGAPGLETATSRSLFALGQRGGVKFSFRISHGEATSVRVSLVRVDDGSTVASWAPPVPSPGAVGSVAWNGLAGSKPAPDGRYAFRLVAESADGAGASNAPPGDVRRDAFDLRPAVFPIRGAHNFGGAGGRFGAGRAGHTHQGQDVMAACGTPLVAARGGVVKAKQYHSLAGYYLVIDGANTGVDYGYMHMAAPSAYAVGDRVHTGDQIGVVGDTGDATACHLHFELWGAPGWYSGGSPFDPLPYLERWDRYS
jgi:murein DD-endopeptidase MepM/ murein hydrolase activator NlpD